VVVAAVVGMTVHVVAVVVVAVACLIEDAVAAARVEATSVQGSAR